MVDVVETPRGVAVVADNMWAAIKGRERSPSSGTTPRPRSAARPRLVAEYSELAKKPGTATARNEGDIDQGFASGRKVLEASFEFPYLAHAALEPLNAVARLNADGTLEVWGGHQMPDLYQAVAAQIAGITPDKVTLHVMKTGGSFGRRATPDCRRHRRGGRGRQGDRLEGAGQGAVDARGRHDGRPLSPAVRPHAEGRPGCARQSRRLAQPHRRPVDPGGHAVRGAWSRTASTSTSVEGAANLPYAIPNLRVELTTTEVGVPVLWWRSVGSTHTAYAIEAFIDEVAEAAGKDPIEFRLALLKDHPRHVGVLKLAAEKAGWGTPAAAGPLPRRRRGRVLQHLRRAGGRGLGGRGRPHQGRARGLRGRLRHRHQSRPDPRADGGRHRLRPRGDPEVAS